jgi:hypothetical protein
LRRVDRPPAQSEPEADPELSDLPELPELGLPELELPEPASLEPDELSLDVVDADVSVVAEVGLERFESLT